MAISVSLQEQRDFLTTTTLHVQQRAEQVSRLRGGRARLQPALLALLLTPWCVLIHGYHPYAEDGGVYLASIEKLLDPSLFATYPGFVAAHGRLSLFPWMLAGGVRLLHLPLMTLLFALYAASIWLTLFAGGLLAKLCVPRTGGWQGAMLLLAAWLSLPVAGTSLMLMDPYVTSRSFSTPMGLFAVASLCFAATAHRGERPGWHFAVLAVAAVLLCVAMHPLMGAYTLLYLCLLGALCLRRGGIRAAIALSASVLLGAAVLAAVVPPSSEAYIQVAHTRTYWFLQQWHWYEWFGIAAPVALFAWAALRLRHEREAMLGRVALAAVFAASTASAIGLLFARPDARSMLLASAQPLRQMHLLYCLMILGLGAAADRLFGRFRVTAWAATMVLFGTLMFYVQRQTFPASAHLETPWSRSTNDWENAFLWIRSHAPQDAVFALDKGYISQAGEDTQNFKAVAERSSVPDYSKDGGIAAIEPQLADEWLAAQQLGESLSVLPDAGRIARFRRTPVTWLVLRSTAVTGFPCPYRNASVKVCRLPWS